MIFSPHSKALTKLLAQSFLSFFVMTPITTDDACMWKYIKISFFSHKYHLNNNTKRLCGGLKKIDDISCREHLPHSLDGV